MKTPNRPAKKTKPRNVPPGKPPKGYRWLSVGEIIESGDCFKTLSGVRPVVFTIGRKIEDFDIEGGNDFFIRPITQPAAKPKRPAAGKLKARVMWADYDPESPHEPVVVYPTRGDQSGNRPDLAAFKVLVLPLDDIDGLVERAALGICSDCTERHEEYRKDARAALRAIGIPIAQPVARKRGKERAK